MIPLPLPLLLVSITQLLYFHAILMCISAAHAANAAMAKAERTIIEMQQQQQQQLMQQQQASQVLQERLQQALQATSTG
jgi:hypothetical protein